MIKKRCIYCGKEYNSKRSHSKYCSSKHRALYHRWSKDYYIVSIDYMKYCDEWVIENEAIKDTALESYIDYISYVESYNDDYDYDYNDWIDNVLIPFLEKWSFKVEEEDNEKGGKNRIYFLKKNIDYDKIKAS